MVKKTNRKLKNKRRTKKRGGLFGISSNADRDREGDLYKYVYTFKHSKDNNNDCITINQQKAMLGDWYGVKKYEKETFIGKLYVGTIFGAKTDRSMTARLLGSDKSVDKQNATEPTNEFDAKKTTRLSWLYANSGLKRAAKLGRMTLSVANTFATGRWPETGYYMVTDITSNKVKTSFKFSRIYYFDEKEKTNYFTVEDASSTSNSDASSTSNSNGFDFTSSKGECSYSNQEVCLIGLKAVIQPNNKKIKEEEITNGNENFINNILFLGDQFDQTNILTSDKTNESITSDKQLLSQIAPLQKGFRKLKINTENKTT